MADNLTLQFKKELEDRASQSSSQSVFTPSSPPSPQGSGSMWEDLQQPEADTSARKEGALNALGAGLWSFADTALFGVPGAFTEEEKFIDFEDPYAKWTAAFGGFAGFVAGAPMKVGAKVVQAVAKPFIKKAGRRSIDSVVREMKTIGVKQGLDKSTIREATSGYRTLAIKSGIDKRLKGEKFTEASEDYLRRFLDKSRIGEAPLTMQQKASVSEMFKNAVKTRPIQDFKGLMALRGVDSRFQRVIGHALNDAVMFGAIDTIFEGVSTIEDHEFDWTAPLWGVANGIAFSQLSWLNPSGKRAKWNVDFKLGLKAAFNKDVYAGMGKVELGASAKFMGESYAASGKSTSRKVLFKGQEKTVNLLADDITAEIKSAFPKANPEDVLKSYLNKERVRWGKDMMKWSTIEEASALRENWMRMIAGGLLFNTHSFVDMYMHDYEPDVSDILPHFLIGAYVQRKSNPSKFDMNPAKINKMRQNMMILGFHPDQLSEIPTFMYKNTRFKNFFNDSKNKSILDLMASEGIISDRYEVVSEKPAVGEKTLGIPENVNPIFESLYRESSGRQGFSKEFGAITVKTQNKILKEFRKIHGDVNEVEASKVFEESYNETTKAFDREFIDTFIKIKDAADRFEPDFDMTYEAGKPLKSKVPSYIAIDEALLNKARDGELKFLKDPKDEGKILKGEEAVDLIKGKIEGFNKILLMTNSLNHTTVLPGNEQRTIKSEEFAEQMYNEMKTAESRINGLFPDKSQLTSPFTFSEYWSDYNHILLDNYTKNFAEGISKVFRKDFIDRDKLSTKLEKSGVLYRADEFKPNRLIDSVEKIKITGTDDAEQIAQAIRVINRALTLQRNSGGYEVLDETILRKGEHKINIDHVNDLNNFLSKSTGNALDLKTINDKLHHKITDFILKDVIEGSGIRMDQANVFFELAGGGFAKFEPAVKGKVGGFQIRLVDEKTLPTSADENSSLKESAVEYNQYVRKMIEDSNGLVTQWGDPIMIRNKTVMQDLYNTISKNYDVKHLARVELMKLANITSVDHPTFSSQLAAAVNAGHESYLFKWLSKVGVIEPTGKKKTEVTINIENFTEEVKKKMVDVMSRHGVTAKYSERYYAEYEQIARESILAEEDVIDYNPRMDMPTFFSRYRIGPESGYEEMAGRDLKKMQASFDDMIYVGADKESRVLHLDSVRKVLKNIWVEHNGEWQHLDTLPERDQYRPKLTQDMIGLLWQQNAQMKVSVVGYDRGSLSKREEVMNKTRFTELMISEIDLPFTIVDPTAIVYEMVDNRYIRRRYLNMYGDSGNLTKKERDLLREHQEKFESLLRDREFFEGEPTRGEDDAEIGLHVMALSRGMSTLAVHARNLHKLHNPFSEFVSRYDIDAVNNKERDRYRKIVEKINSEDILTPQDYSYMLRRIMFERMLVGSDGNRTFLEFLNGERIEKLMSRSKLFHTKKFVRTDKQFIDDARYALLETAITGSHQRAADVLKRYSYKNGFNVSIWNDVDYAPLIASADAWAVKLGVKWKASDMIGEAHADKSRYDSIGFVSRDMMTLLHTLLGHNPNSTNPLKPVITSGGPDSPLLLGKTLFIYSPAMNSTFNKNKGLDIVITKSGSKVYNPKGVEVEGEPWDQSIINQPVSKLITRRGLKLGPGKIRKITLESLGVMPMKDTYESSASEGMSDFNYARNREHGRIYKEMYEKQIETNMDYFERVARDPISIRQWIMSTMGDEAITPSREAGEAMNHISNMHLFSSLTKDANPMSLSENIVKNKMYGMYMHGILNNKRSVVNQFTQKEVPSAENFSHRYGGQAYFIQAPEHNLRPTFTDRNGQMISRGETMLPNADREARLTDLISTHEMEFRFVKGTEVIKPEDALGSNIITVKGKKKTISVWQEFLNADGTLGTLFEMVEYGKNNKLYDKDLQIGVIVKRFPRTRPNDMSILALKGFLAEEYGRAIAVNSLDVANVYEGDYDADKADYLFASKKSFYDHVERASQFSVQGIDVEKLQTESRFTFNGAPATEDAAIRKMIADDNVWKQSIGIVQKIPRKLSFLGHLGSIEADPTRDPYVSDYIRTVKGEDYVPRSLFKGDRFKIIMDFDNSDFYTRSALETQYIIDGKGNLNKDIASSIRHWGDEFLFPRIEDSKTASEIHAQGVGFVNDMRTKGHSFNKRVRIFRRIEQNEAGEFVEKELTSLDKAMVKELMSEYGSFLNSTGKESFGKSGDKNRATFDGVMSGAHRFFTFNQNIKDGLYYRLRNRRIDPSIEKSKKWYKDKDFNNLFGVQEQKPYKKDDKKVRWWKSTKSPIETSVEENAKEISRGERGSVLERMVWKMYNTDPFETVNVKGVTGEVRGIMSDWYNQIVEGTYGNYGDATEILRNKVTKSAFKINDAIDVIASMQKQVMITKHNSKIPYKIRVQKIDNANKVINDMLSKIKPMIPKSYWKTRRAKELMKAKVEFVSVEEKNLIDGAIQYATINNLRSVLGKSPSYGMDADAISLLKEIKQVRKLFYGNFDNLKDVLRYKDTTVLSKEMKEFLSNMPDLSTVHEIENGLLLRGYKDHHMKFIYAFMDPGTNPTSIGVFDNQVVPVPYQSSKRYSRGLQFLTQMMTGFEKDASPAQREKWIKTRGDEASDALKMLQTVEAHWRRFYSRKIDQRGISETVVDIGAPEIGSLALSHVKMPDFHRDFAKTYTSFSRIDWRRETDRIGIGSGMMNDHLIQFYSDIMNLAGKGEEFTSYLQRMNALQSDMMSNRTMNPIKYLSMRSLMDKEVRQIAETVLTGGLTDKNNTYVKNIINNPVYAIMGGPGHYKGLSLEGRSFLNRNELKNIIKMNENLKGYDTDLKAKSSSSKKQIRKVIAECATGKL